MLAVSAALLTAAALGLYFAGSRTVGIVSCALLAFLFPLVVLPLAALIGAGIYLYRSSK